MQVIFLLVLTIGYASADCRTTGCQPMNYASECWGSEEVVGSPNMTSCGNGTGYANYCCCTTVSLTSDPTLTCPGFSSNSSSDAPTPGCINTGCQPTNYAAECWASFTNVTTTNATCPEGQANYCCCNAAAMETSNPTCPTFYPDAPSWSGGSGDDDGTGGSGSTGGGNSDDCIQTPSLGCVNWDSSLNPTVDTTPTIENSDSDPAANISYSMFVNAVTLSGYTQPCLPQYNGFMTSLSWGGITTLGMAAMALANFIHETGGLIHTFENNCGPGGNAYYDSASTCQPSSPNMDSEYYGRGYIQLSWNYNYGSASYYLFGDASILLNNPDLVGLNETLAWGAAMWYWKIYVGADPLVQNLNFGATIYDINNGECASGVDLSDPTNFEAAQRGVNYQNVRKAFGLCLNCPQYSVNGCAGGAKYEPPSGSTYCLA